MNQHHFLFSKKSKLNFLVVLFLFHFGLVFSQEKTTQHQVRTKETVYGIAKLYKLKIEDLYKLNPNLEKEGLKIGQIITISNSAEIQSTPIINTPETIEYEVLSKESWYSIARKFSISVADLQKANLNLKSLSLQVGQKILIPNSNTTIPKKEVEKVAETPKIEPKKEALPVAKVEIEKPKEPTVIEEITHLVLTKETKYGIAKQYGITVSDLEKQNPNITNRLLVGTVLKIKTSKIIETKPSIVEKAIEKVETKLVEIETTEKREFDANFPDQLIAKASENIGTRYQSGGTTPLGFDCSGLMFYTFNSYDFKLPRSSIEMASVGTPIDFDKAQKGDLIFFKTNGRDRINHVGLVVEVVEDEIKFIHSSNQKGVIISSTKEPYYQKSVVQVNRVLQQN